MNSRIWIIVVLAYCSSFARSATGNVLFAPATVQEHPESTQLLWQWLRQNWDPTEARLFFETKDHRLQPDARDDREMNQVDDSANYKNTEYNPAAEEIEVDTEPEQSDHQGNLGSIDTWSPSTSKRSSASAATLMAHMNSNLDRATTLQDEPRVLGLLGSHKAFAKWSSHGDQFIKQVMKHAARRHSMKRSPNCMRKCMAQGLLHPAQCHSLC